MIKSKTKEYKRDWMWRKRHNGEEPPPYKPKAYKPKGNLKWIELIKEERLWKKSK